MRLHILTHTRRSVTLALTLACSPTCLLPLSHALSYAGSRCRMLSHIFALVLIQTRMNTTCQSLIHIGCTHGIQEIYGLVVEGSWCVTAAVTVALHCIAGQDQ